MSQPDALIFDMDGTLWDTNQICTDAWNEVFEQLGLQRRITLAELTSLVGLSFDDVREKIFADLSIEAGTKLQNQCFEHSVTLVRKRGGKLYDGVSNGLEKLAGQFQLALVSNCESNYLDAFQEISGIAQHFIDFECHGNTGLPKSENITRTMRRNNFQNVIYIGDTIWDESAARKANVKFAYVAYGFGHAEAPDYRFSSFTELVKMFL